MVTWTRAARAAEAYHGTAWAGLDERARQWEIGRMIAALSASDGPAPILSPVDRGVRRTGETSGSPRHGGSGEARDGEGVDLSLPAAGDIFHHPL